MAIKRCKASFAAVIGGVPRVVNVGALLDSSDPIVRGREAHFEDVDDYMTRRHPGVEAATAEPGEKRSLMGRRAAKKTAAKKPAAQRPTTEPGDQAPAEGDSEQTEPEGGTS